jgi:hypothetical protein
MSDFGREKILAYLKEEVVGPRTTGKSLDTSIQNVFTEKGEAQGPWVDVQSGQEILYNLKPSDRYGAGVLHPRKDILPIVEVDETSPEEDFDEVEFPAESDELALNGEPVADEEQTAGLDGEPELEQKDDARKPTSMGISFFVRLSEESEIAISIAGGWYSRFTVSDQSGARKNQVDCYLRNKFNAAAKLAASQVLNIQKKTLIELPLLSETDSPLKLKLIAFIRPWENGEFLVTLSFLNISCDEDFPKESLALFQTEISLRLSDSVFLPYPNIKSESKLIEGFTYQEKARLDDESTELLFSGYPTIAIGHNCSVDWPTDVSEVNLITASCFPVFEAPSITPDIKYSDGTSATLDMRLLSDLERKTDSMSSLERLVDEYEKWISGEQSKFFEMSDFSKFENAFKANISECNLAVKRMRKGLDLLAADPLVYEAFRITNLAMLNQQSRSKLPLRSSGIATDGKIFVDGDYPALHIPETLGFWRAFQIAFVLNAIESISNETSTERETVDLIFFPTGGGKTEAYLGVIAFTIALQRLRDKEDCGTAVLMRYTLRLLTTQQFSRAASLICALESIRRQDPMILGHEEISIGAWLGSSVTPNRQQDAVKQLTIMKSNQKQKNWKKDNPFLILQCPWCAASMGPVDKEMNKHAGPSASIPGYEVTGVPRRVRFRCPDSRCEFNIGLPLYVVDEDLYNFRPTLVIGTVDKFALLAWKSESRALFGRSDSGNASVSPPSLIIQDEFHLISGPLGSMVGLYETVVEHLATKVINGGAVKPKIISSTATIRRFWAQANAVYGRTDVSLFPPPLRDVSDSFFAVWSRNQDTGKLSQGRKYVGIYMPGTGSIRSSEVRVGSALALAPMRLDEEERDPWWTNLWFFNDLKQLGTAISLFHNDIAKYMSGLVRRDGLAKRNLSSPEELTSRRQNSEIPKVLQQLSQSYIPGLGPKKQKAWDTCLASNIIEVGIDVDRLSLMTVVGQPKSTAQYIQVTGRVGRKWYERPGLVVTLYSMGRARDLSHFEHFRSYHERLYAQVEPTSVTPFSIPVVGRALRGAITALIRTTLPQMKRPREVEPVEFEKIAEVFRNRFDSVQGTSEEEAEYLESSLGDASSELSKWMRDEWEGENGLLRRQVSDGSEERLTWTIPSSMRNVDASVELSITDQYFEIPEDEGAETENE